MTTRKLPPAIARSATTERIAPQSPRRFLRASVLLPAQYALGGEIDWSQCTIDDLGGGGVRVQTERDLEAGTVLFLRFAIDGALITVTARIVMSFFDKPGNRYVHGIAFTAIDPQHRALIVAHVTALDSDRIGA